MTETLTGTHRSAGMTYAEILDTDSHPVRAILRADSPMEPGPTLVPVERYFSRAFHDLEVEKVWKRVWQMACHADDIPDVGDYLVYDIAHLSFLIVHDAPGSYKAFHNACLHRGKLLREENGKWARELRCSFHGWSWNLDGSLKEIPCRWDFQYPEASDTCASLPQVKLGTWGGFIFINPDPDAEPLEDYLGTLSEHFTLLPYEKRYKSAHVAKVLRCNWKVAQEAFSEAYHVVATHPQILGGIGDANTKYDVFGNYSRAISPQAVPSPHLRGMPDYGPTEGASLYRKLRHPLSGAIYERGDDGYVHVTTVDGRHGRFTDQGTRVDGDLGQVDPNMCDWIGGMQLPNADRAPLPPWLNGDVTDAAALRKAVGDMDRAKLRPIIGDVVDEVSDAELCDSIYLTLFPNFHPWGSFNQIVYRFRPYGDDPDQCIHECMYFSAAPIDGPRPPAAPMHWLGADDDWVQAPELGMLAKVFNQDVHNMPHVQAGLKAMKQPYVMFGDYGETKLRHFHQLLQEWIDKP
jgi:nitrite reductase/ring-hydroxylating ferredoxin subunit